MTEYVDINDVIAALQRLGYGVTMERGTLVGLDTHDTHEFPITIDRAQRMVPLEDILDNVRVAGISSAEFRAALASVSPGTPPAPTS